MREVLARHGLAARKSLGQHFLNDLNLTARIAAAAGDLTGATVIEVGPGAGALTRALLATPAREVIAIERDARCLAALEELAAAYPGRLTVVEGDALEVDAPALGPAPRHVVANLPYNVATPLLLRWLGDLANSGAYAGLTLMFQREVAERLAAVPRTKAYGRLSVITQWLCDVTLAFDVARAAFTPPPKVVSTVVRLVPRAAPLAPANFATLERVTAAAFGQRRKMLRSSLKPLGGTALLDAAGVPATARAEELTVAQFCALARALDAA